MDAVVTDLAALTTNAPVILVLTEIQLGLMPIAQEELVQSKI
jgi:hypothetical protein